MKPEKWIRHPVCGNKTYDKMREDTVLLNFPLYCPKYKQETFDLSSSWLNLSYSSAILVFAIAQTSSK